MWRRACVSSLPRRERGRVQPPPPPLPRSGCELRLVPEAALGALLAEATRSGPHVRRPCCPPELAPPARPRRPPAAPLAGEAGRPHFAACGRPSRPCWKSSPGTVTPRVPVGVRTAVRTCARHGPAQGLEAKTRCRGLPPARSRRAFEATGGLCALDWGRLWPPSSLAASYGRRATQPRPGPGAPPGGAGGGAQLGAQLSPQDRGRAAPVTQASCPPNARDAEAPEQRRLQRWPCSRAGDAAAQSDAGWAGPTERGELRVLEASPWVRGRRRPRPQGGRRPGPSASRSSADPGSLRLSPDQRVRLRPRRGYAVSTSNVWKASCRQRSAVRRGPGPRAAPGGSPRGSGAPDEAAG